MAAGSFVISLDFELFWGMCDHSSLKAYGANILGGRAAIPILLKLFREYEVRATWAAVGLLLFGSKKELRGFVPEWKPSYARAGLSPYAHLEQIGEDERSDPYHYGLSLARQIVATEGMELASHTFSHYYCLEAGQTPEQFKADMEASAAAVRRLGVSPRSVIFPRNQYGPEHLKVCSELGFLAYRGTQRSWMYRTVSREAEMAIPRRAAQLADLYFNLSGHNGFVPATSPGMVNLPASRLLRPYDPKRKLLEPLRLHRILDAMSGAARSGASFHLWWHPHNFGANLEENLALLTRILRHHAGLRERYGVRSTTMQDEASGCLGVAA
jgi:peptidoglycan/xylan/chitin deacetylase (PgdA/CDA1 family)